MSGNISSARPRAEDNNSARLSTASDADRGFFSLRNLYRLLLLLSVPLAVLVTNLLLAPGLEPWLLIASVAIGFLLLLLHTSISHSEQAQSRHRFQVRKDVTDFVNRSQQKMRYLASQLKEETRLKNELEQKLIKLESETRLRIEERTRELSETNELLNQQIKLRQSISNALGRSQTRLSQAISASNLGLWDWDLTSQTLHQSPFNGVFNAKEHSSKAYFRLLRAKVHPDDYAGLQEAIGDYLDNKSSHFKVSYRVFDAEQDTWLWIEDQGKAVSRDKSGQVLRMLGTRRDITQQRRHEEQMQLAQSVFDQTNEGIFVLNHRFEMVSVNQAFRKITGFEESELLGKKWLDLSHSPQKNKVFKQARLQLAQSGYWDAELLEQRKNGEYFPVRVQVNTIRVASAGTSYFAGLISDQTNNKEADEKLRYLLNYDELTGLANRTLFKDRMHNALVRARESLASFALLYVDIDRFKQINQNFGHEHADTLLKHFASRLSGSMNQADTIARLGDDEFAIILPGKNREDTGDFAREILREITKPYYIGNQELIMSSSIGISTFPGDGKEIPQLIRQAGVAVRQAKYLGGNNFQFYTKELVDKSRFIVSIETDLRNALKKGELEVYYQPKLSLHNLCIESVEALVRWNHPGRGMISPTDFVNVAEESGLITEIGANVMETACKQARTWYDQGIGTINVAINLSAYQLRQKNITERVKSMLTVTHLPPNQVELELTESSIIENMKASVSLLEEFSKMGMNLSVDDFGTGYSSFSYLRNLPVNSLKIDRSFIRNVDTSARDAAICKAIIALAQTLKLKVVAEGVENKAQFDFLKTANCDVIQGYYLSKPLSAPEMTTLLQQQAATVSTL